MLYVRHAEPEDYPAVQKIYTAASVYRQLTQDPFPSLDMWRQRLAEPKAGFYDLLACYQEEVVGQLGLTVHHRSRRKHCGALGMAVREDWHGKGVGSSLMAAAIDLADNWLNLRRLELEVLVDNEAAIALYTKFGFEQFRTVLSSHS